ncbi:MAG: hypothetical protein BA872_02910 [Desulfobacterales bacterium C00003060]|nr:MAG: hypothetical protein BA872_02910 [Desulfobacterales bacterium C00003060]
MTNVENHVGGGKDAASPSYRGARGGILCKKLQNKMDLVELGNRGITKDAVSHLAKYLSLSWKQMASLLPVTERTSLRYAPEHHMSTTVSKQVLQIAEAVALGTQVFGSRDRFLSWLSQPSTALADRAPLELLGSRFGTELVVDELGRIKHGVHS